MKRGINIDFSVSVALISAVLTSIIVLVFACQTASINSKSDDTAAPTTTAPVETEKPITTAATEESTAEPQPVLVSLGIFEATAYCPCEYCCGKTDGITASCTQATAGRTIAVDTDVIPFGTEIIINGHTYVAEDIGGAIKNNSVDIFFDSHEAALEFGRQYVEVFVYE